MFGIRGLLYVSDYLTRARHDELVRVIDSQPWRLDLVRRTQQYGFVYEHKNKALNRSHYLGPLPDWLAELGQDLQQDGLMDPAPDQAIINEYEPGQGIGKHVDAAPAFGPVVVSLSLLSRAVMDFKRADGDADGDREPASLVLEPRSLLVLRGEARYDWKHGMAPRRADIIEGVSVPRERRISVTFRTVTDARAVRP